MFNILLDELPDEWESPSGNVYKLETDFRIGIQICQIQSDNDLTQIEKYVLARKLLFADKCPESREETIECIDYFMNNWNHDNTSSKKEDEQLMDFDVDQWRIYAAFLEQYKIDLKTCCMHWWEFMGLLSSLQECTYTRVINIRGKKITPSMSKEDKKTLREAKEIYTLGKKMTREEIEMENSIYDFLGGNNCESEQRRIKEFEKYADT